MTDDVELDRITITRTLAEHGPEVTVEGSDGLTWYDAMAMVHIAADTISQGGLSDDEDDA